jgi:hypothetical protein
MLERSWQHKTAGILMIASGVIFMASVVLVVFWIEACTTPYYSPGREPSQSEFMTQFVLKCLPGLIGIFPIIGGVFCLKRKWWRIAIAGAIFTLVLLLPLYTLILITAIREPAFSQLVYYVVPITIIVVGITPFILLLKSRKQFTRK